MAIRVVSTRIESDGSLDATSLFIVKRKFFVSNKELKRKQVLFQKLFGLICWFVKVEFLNGENAWLTFY